MTPVLMLLACAGQSTDTSTTATAVTVDVGGGDGPEVAILDTVTPGAPVAGVAEGPLDFPVGSPLGGYTGRCECFGDEGEVDKRDSAYIYKFNRSVGVQTRPRGQAVWLENGDQDLLLLKGDIIYSFDGLVEDLEERLTAATGIDMESKVVVATNHSHNAPANYAAGMTWFLGGDKYNEEVFQRLSTSLADLALEAWESRQAAAIGVGIAKDWDPSDAVYSDRRPENDELVFFDDIEAGAYKDPYLTVLRIDTADGAPMALLHAFGVHGTSLGGDNEMWSSDAPGAVELAVQEYFDTPVLVGHLQTGAGDASPRGSDGGYARLETVGAYAAEAIIDLWERTPTTTDPIRMESVTHAVDMDRDKIRITRNGTMDLHYAAYDPDEDFTPDEEIYAADGSIISPIDEFNTQYGGAFCGEDIPLIPGVSVGSASFPYNSCIEVETIAWVILGFFGLEEADLQLPLPESTRATVTAARIGPLPFSEVDGTETTDDLLLAFFPGEMTAMFTEQFRRRAAAELGMKHALPVGYAQDHEGYLLIPEDWLTGGYEIAINIWGPLSGEYLMEGVLDIGERWLLTDALEPADAGGVYQPVTYRNTGTLPTAAPDVTPDAGMVLDEIPEYMYTPVSADPALQPDAELPRVQGLAQLTWAGGDPGVDTPEVFVERLEDGDWVEVTTASGRPVNDTLHDVLLAHTPDPLYPWEDAQTHTWWAGWQVVGTYWERAGIPAGTYRLHAYGDTYGGTAETWPWDTEPYEVISDSFEVVPAELSLSLHGSSLSASLNAPAWGYRLIDTAGYSTGANPIEDGVVTFIAFDGTETVDSAVGTSSGGVTTFEVTVPGDAVEVVLTDVYGNIGTLELGSK